MGFGKKEKKRRHFGKMTDLSNVMSDYSPQKISIFQQYTGMSPKQMQSHIENIPASLRDNFYSSSILN